MEELLLEAKEKGLFVVNSEQTEDNLEKEYLSRLKEAEELCEHIDPESKPFESKYKAREILDQLLKQLEANKTIASLEKKGDLITKLNIFIANIQLKIGSISWDCEEPHNAQNELEAACQYYFPSLIETINELVGNQDELFSQVDTDPKIAEQLMKAEEITPPEHILSSNKNWMNQKLISESVKCLNLLGILWAGRGQPYKSLFYLLTANYCYSVYRQAELPIGEVLSPISLSGNKELEDAYTHNLFYLAQAYGNMKIPLKSSTYCQQTLQRQLISGLIDLKTSLEWVKNCCGIADFYLAMGQYHACSFALLSAEKVLKEKVIQTLFNELDKQQQADDGSSSTADATAKGPQKHQKPNFVMGNLNAAEIEADLHRRWAIFDVQILRRAADRYKELEAAKSLDIDEAEVNRPYEILPEEAELLSRLGYTKGCTTLEFFKGLLIQLLPFTDVMEVVDFEKARTVFLRSAARIDAAKKYYVLDGKIQYPSSRSFLRLSNSFEFLLIL
jgi:hypothetical protein